MMQTGNRLDSAKWHLNKKACAFSVQAFLNSIAECALHDGRDYSVIGAMFASNRMPSMIAVHVDVALTYIEVPAS